MKISSDSLLLSANNTLFLFNKTDEVKFWEKIFSRTNILDWKKRHSIPRKLRQFWYSTYFRTSLLFKYQTTILNTLLTRCYLVEKYNEVEFNKLSNTSKQNCSRVCNEFEILYPIVLMFLIFNFICIPIILQLCFRRF